MKKYFPFFLMLALVSTLLAACVNTADVTAETDSGAQTTETEAATEGETSTETATSTEVGSSTEAEATTKAETSADTVISTETETSTDTETSTEAKTSTHIETSTEAKTSTHIETSTKAEASTDATTSTAVPSPVLTIDDVAFVGDSRTLTMATGGRLEFDLIPATSVFATWGGELHQDSAKNNARDAAAADRELAIFWYGINDVQSDPEQTLSDQFLANYRAIIDLYRVNNPDSAIVILSILSTSVNEKDYYPGQEENIRTYNAKLAGFCAQEGYTYLDITALFTGDECLAPNDYIHFSKEWYETRFLPTILQQLNMQ